MYVCVACFAGCPCLYVYVSICMYVCMYVCVFWDMPALPDAHVSICMYVCMFWNVSAFVYSCINVCVYVLYACMRVCVYVCTHVIYIYIYIYQVQVFPQQYHNGRMNYVTACACTNLRSTETQTGTKKHTLKTNCTSIHA